MEADWEVEIGLHAPVIEGCWEGLVDLQRQPDMAAQLAEGREFPALAEALVRLNSASSPVRTVKCDLWRPAEFDPDELDAAPEEGNCAMACYIDLLPRDHCQWTSPDEAVTACAAIRAHLAAVPLQSCRVDLVVRQAYLGLGDLKPGVTAYLTACGSTAEGARTTLAAALDRFVNVILCFEHPRAAPKSYNGRTRASSSIG